MTVPWPEGEPDRIDTHLARLDQLHHRIEELLMAQEESTEADRIAEERMREANAVGVLLSQLTARVGCACGGAGGARLYRKGHSAVSVGTYATSDARVVCRAVSEWRTPTDEDL